MPAHEIHPDLLATRKYDVGECDVPSQVMATQDSLISPARLLGLKGDQFMTLSPPVVQCLKHLWSFRHQFVKAEERSAILKNQEGIWTDDEFRFLVQAHLQHQCKHSDVPVRQSTLLDPLLITGWLHHGHQACVDWSSARPEIKKDGCLLIMVCILGKNWIPLVLTPMVDRVQIVTWDSPSRDHTKLNVVCEAIGKALGFSQVVFERHHRLFFSSDTCGHCFPGMLPTCPQDVMLIHDRSR